METMVFPFEKVEKGSKIACYGFGKAGIQFWLQLNKSHYCDVVLWVDRAWERMKNGFVDIRPIEALFELKNDEYDYLVIAIENESLARFIKRDLVEKGILENKIICASERYVTDYKFEKLFGPVVDKLNKYFGAARLFWTKTVNSPEKYFPILMELIKGKEDNNTFNFIKNKISCMEAGTEKLIMLRFLYDLELFSPDCMQMIHETLFEMKWVDDTPFFMVMDTSHMIHYGIASSCIYPKFYVDRRKLLKKICDYYDLNTESAIAKSKTNTDIKRIAILGFHLEYGCTDPATELVVKYAEDLLNEGYEVKVFITNTVQEPEEACSVIAKRYVLASSKQTDADRINKKYDIFYAESKTVKGRLQEILDQVISFDPDLVLDMSDDFCPQTYLLHKLYPILCFPMRVGMTSSFLDYVFEMDLDDFRQKNAIFHSVEDEQCLSVKLANMLETDETTIYERSRFDLDEKDFVIVTVGGRLSYELDDELLVAVCEFLHENDNVRWLIIGDELDRDNGLFNKLVHEHRIINTGWEEHIEALYRICDIYLEPRRHGGSHGMRLAMRIGLPVVISDHPSDNRCLFEEKQLCTNVKEMISEVEHLYTDAVYKKEMSEKSKEIIDNLTKESDGKKLMDTYIKTVKEKQLAVEK